ncbi:hypothetical protein C8Q74DRAFT_19924 [Fomes fomentarius]|nr:hypothetical protein C8Q74DRAFT_19924 [Fomes fomentarius]
MNKTCSDARLAVCFVIPPLCNQSSVECVTVRPFRVSHLLAKDRERVDAGRRCGKLMFAAGPSASEPPDNRYRIRTLISQTEAYTGPPLSVSPESAQL